MGRLKVGIIGTGMAFEKLHYPAYQELKDQYEIVAVCDHDRGKASSWAERLGVKPQHVYTDYLELAKLEEVQIIDIMVPISQNFITTEAVAKLVAGKKKAIICEKPLAPNLEQAKAAAGLSEKYQVPIMIAENYRYNEDPKLIKELLNQGQIGEVDYFLWNRVLNFPDDMRRDAFPAKEWRQYPDFPGGVFYDTAVHDLAALRYIFGEIDELTAYGQRKEITLGQFSIINVIIRFQTGFTGTYNFYTAGKEMQRPLVGLRILGRNGEIYQEERDCGVINLALNDGTERKYPYRPQRGYYNELLNLYHAYLGEEEIAVTPQVEFGDAQTALAILESIEEETPVKVDGQLDFYETKQLKSQAEYQNLKS